MSPGGSTWHVSLWIPVFIPYRAQARMTNVLDSGLRDFVIIHIHVMSKQSEKSCFQLIQQFKILHMRSE